MPMEGEAMRAREEGMVIKGQQMMNAVMGRLSAGTGWRRWASDG
jgi:hypothetical protein